jgi:hypothetical protein
MVMIYNNYCSIFDKLKQDIFMYRMDSSFTATVKSLGMSGTLICKVVASSLSNHLLMLVLVSSVGGVQQGTSVLASRVGTRYCQSRLQVKGARILYTNRFNIDFHIGLYRLSIGR